MKVSVIVPAFNADRYIDECLHSISGQTYPALEILVVNDGSTDQTKRKIEVHMSQDPRIILIDQPNMGITMARSAGLTKSSGEVILFLDADDYLSQNAIELLLTKMQETDAGMVIGNYFRLENQKKKVFTNQLPDTQDNIQILQYLLYGRLTGYVWGRLIRRKLLEDVQIPGDLSYAEDILTNLAIFCKNTVKTVLVPDPIVHYRIHDKNTSSSQKSEYVESIMMSAKYAKAVLKQHGQYRKLRMAYRAYLCRNWVIYCRRSGQRSMQKALRHSFFLENFKFASKGIPIYQKIELILYTINPRVGKSATNAMQWIRNVIWS